MRIRIYMVITDPLNKRLEITAIVNQLEVRDTSGTLELSTHLDSHSDVILVASERGFDVEKNRGAVVNERDIIRTFLTFLTDMGEI